ncbi:MAG: DUF962 domain-containing protein [Woeseiaceae bacterium]
MQKDSKLMDMLTGYAAAHQHPFNILVHLLGIPTIMLGVLIPLTWLSVGEGATAANLGHLLIFAFFLFYMTLDQVFAIVFLILALLLNELASRVGALPMATSGSIAAACFFGGYALQFIGHAVEKSMPVLVKHPIQANLAAPFFTIVEIFKIVGLRSTLFNAVQEEIAARRQTDAASSSG